MLRRVRVMMDRHTYGEGATIKKLSIILAFIIVLSSLNIFSIETKAASSWDFNYTGSIQSFKAPYTGRYYLECYGASGGLTGTETYGWGGYSSGYYNLKAGQTVYIVVGGQGARNSAGGYNGGGAAYNGAYSGGGATHIALRSGLLKNLSGYKDQVLCVAGGGGGAGSQGNTGIAVIGAGGGTIGSASNAQVEKGVWITFANESNLTSGYAFGQGQDYHSVYSDTYGGGYGGAGGGGWYGGYQSFSGFAGGSGGSGYTEPLAEITARTGVHKGNGKAKITYAGEIKSTLTIEIDNGGYWNGVDTKVAISGTWPSTLNLGQLQVKQGWTLQGWQVLEGDGTVSGNTFTFGSKDTVIRAKWKAPLTLTSQQSGTSLRLNFQQPDGQPKIFKVYQSLDKVSWKEVDNADQDGALNEKKQYNYTGSVQTFVAPFSGLYTVELYGAQGGADRYAGGLGGYVSGRVYLEKGKTVYIYVGGKGANAGSNRGGMTPGGWNGGGSGGEGEGGGGGATDIRIGGTANGTAGLDNRVMVAGGGGGSGNWAGEISQGADGGLTLAENCKNGKFKGQDAESARDGQGAGGGGGYYGGKKKVQGWGDYGGWGGTNYLGPDVIFISNMPGQRTGNGYATIQGYDSIIMDNFVSGITLYDDKAPTVPSNGQQSRSGLSVKVTFDASKDLGRTFYHKVASYNSADLTTVVSESTVVENTYTSGLKGYYYYFDTNETGTVTTSNSTFTTGRSVNCSLKDNNGNYFKKLYLHVAAIDNAGNLSGTYNYKIDTVYEVFYDKNDTTYNINGNKTSTKATGTTNSTLGIIGEKIVISDSGFTKKGYTFSHWNTKPDDTGKEFKPGDIVSFEDLSSNTETKLYAIWKPNEFTVTLHGNGNWNNKGDVTINTEFDKITKLPDSPYTRNPSDGKVINGYKIAEPFEFIGWSNDRHWQPDSTTKKYDDKADITNIIDGGSSKNYDLYAIWRKTITLTFDLTGGYKDNNLGPIRLQSTIYNDQLSTVFGLMSDRDTTSTDAYGNFDSNGINSRYKKFNKSDLSESRFLGWSADNSNNPLRSGKIQGSNVNLFVYDTSNRSGAIQLYDSQTLKACWEQVLNVSVEVGRTLGSLEYEDNSVVHALKVTDLTAEQSTDGVILRTIVRPGEQGYYSIRKSNTADDTVTVVKFDTSVTDIYDNGDSTSQWYDGLNPPADNPLDIDQKHGLNRSYLGKGSYISNKWFTPNYFGTDKSYETSKNKESYTFDIIVSQPSVYWEYIHNSEETVSVKVLIDVTSKADYTPGEGDSGHAPGGEDTTLDELRTRLKIRLL